MTRFTVTAAARKDLDDLPAVVRRRLATKLRYWQQSPHPLRFAVSLTQHQLATHRFRVGAYRIIVRQIGRRELRILRIRHRREVYR